ncbi:MAG TPA: hypothetical protein VHW23_38230 [Kofleriaceae bacterium]|jgi:hypothetical protein|nr:hypothetical protein [Kofleriaceae bacterium]
MTKRGVPTPARGQVVEIDAMDVAEWESGQRTPQASDANLAELVRKSAATPPAATPVPAAHAQTVPRERARTQMGTPAIPRPPSRARTEPPGPPPKPATDGKKLPRAQTAGGPAASSGRARVPDIPAAPAAPSPEPPRLPTPSAGIEFALPVTATSPATSAMASIKAPAPRRVSTGSDFSLPVTTTGEISSRSPEPEPRRSPAPMTSKGIDFSPPVTATSPAVPGEAASARPVPPASPDFSMPGVETSPRPPADPPRLRSQARPGSEPPRTATATSESGARPPQLDPPPGLAPLPAPVGSPFAEPSQVGPGRNAAPAGGIEPNTAWPPRPIPVSPSVQPAPPVWLAAPGPSIQSMQPAPPPVRDDAAGAERLQVGLSRRRLWWIGGGIAAASIGAIVAAWTIPAPEAPAPGASDASATEAAAQAPGPRRNPRAEPPVDRAAADLRERVRLAREAAAAGVPMTVPVEPVAVERRSAPPAEIARKPTFHKVIVDYSARPNEPPPPSLVAQSEEDPAIGMARTAYTSGNQRLFVGDVKGAIQAYHQALELYPGYVGGFRGLGLAYEELGETTNALTALRAYVAAAPTARDIVLIKKRIVHLQHH